MVAVAELDLELDAREERRRWPEHDLVAAGLEVAGELGDTAVAVRLTRTRAPLAAGPARRARPRPASPLRCRARVSRRRRSCGESSRLHPMGTRDLVLVGMDESAAAHDVLALRRRADPRDAAPRRRGRRQGRRHRRARDRRYARPRSRHACPARASRCRRGRGRPPRRACPVATPRVRSAPAARRVRAPRGAPASPR